MLAGHSCYAGFRVIESNYMTEKGQRRKHRKVRVNKKWLKRYGYKDVPSSNVFLMKAENTIIAHPVMAKKIKNQLSKMEIGGKRK